jgi:hypothetical protein
MKKDIHVLAGTSRNSTGAAIRSDQRLGPGFRPAAFKLPGPGDS